MLDEMLVNITPYECRVALLANEQVQELYIERVGARSLVGNIYKGKITRVLPGMQAAFVDIGLERAGFLHAGSIAPMNGTGELPVQSTGVNINDHCYLGQELLVQVTRDPIGTKGARLSAHLSLSSRYLVYMPALKHDFIFKEGKRHKEPSQVSGGFIARTRLLEQPNVDLTSEKQFLQDTWSQIQDKANTAKVGACCYEECSLPVRVWRDRLYGAPLAHSMVLLDDRAMCHQLHDYAKKTAPALVETIQYYDSYKPIFDLYQVEQDIVNALKPACSLPSGGYLLIEQTEAMSTIDVNTGAYVGKENADETFLQTNLEAVAVIARQLRLRNLGGIIVLDFIDMDSQAHRKTVRDALIAALSNDLAKTSVSEFSGLGLIEISRQRMRESLEHILCEACPHCRGTGSVKRLESVCMDVVREIKRKYSPFDDATFTVIASPMVVEHLLSSEAIIKEALKQVAAPITYQTDVMFGIDKFEVLLV